MPNLKFLTQTVLEIWRVSENSKSRSRDPLPTPFDLIFHFFVVSVPGDLSACRIWSFLLKPLEPPVLNLHTKFEVFSSNRSRDMDWFKNSKSRSRDTVQTRFDLIFNFHRYCLRWSMWVPNLKLLTQCFLEIWRYGITWPPPKPLTQTVLEIWRVSEN